MEYRDHQGMWHTKLVKSYGQFFPETQRLAQQDLAEIQQLASQDDDPIPIGTVDQAIWDGFYRTLENPIRELPVIPLNALRDFAHLGAWIIDSVSGNLPQKVSHTHPHMSPVDQARLVLWIQQKPAAEHAKILAYLWLW
jgi:hypothetical protein